MIYNIFQLSKIKINKNRIFIWGTENRKTTLEIFLAATFQFDC